MRKMAALMQMDPAWRHPAETPSASSELTATAWSLSLTPMSSVANPYGHVIRIELT